MVCFKLILSQSQSIPVIFLCMEVKMIFTRRTITRSWRQFINFAFLFFIVLLIISLIFLLVWSFWVKGSRTMHFVVFFTWMFISWNVMLYIFLWVSWLTIERSTNTINFIILIISNLVIILMSRKTLIAFMVSWLSIERNFILVFFSIVLKWFYRKNVIFQVRDSIFWLSIKSIIVTNVRGLFSLLKRSYLMWSIVILVVWLQHTWRIVCGGILMAWSLYGIFI